PGKPRRDYERLSGYVNSETIAIKTLGKVESTLRFTASFLNFHFLRNCGILEKRGPDPVKAAEIL
ncbi:MAG: hypothetical protein ACLTAC_08365, partial [Hungatella sp.]